MALPASGPLAFSDINVELGNSATATLNLDDSAARSLCGVPSGAIDVSDFYAASSLAFKASRNSNSNTISWPTTSFGDVAILLDVALNASASTKPTNVVPSGFVQIGTNSEQIYDAFPELWWARVTLSAKKCTGSESGNITGMNGTEDNNKILLLFDAGATSINPQGFTNGMTTGNPNSKTITASGGTTPLIVVGACCALKAESTNFTTQNPSFDSVIAKTNNDTRFGYKIYSSGSASNHTINMGNDGDGNILAGAYVEIT